MQQTLSILQIPKGRVKIKIMENSDGGWDHHLLNFPFSFFKCIRVSGVILFCLEHSKHLKQDVSRELQGYLRGVCLKFQGCFKEVSRVLTKSFRGVSRKFKGCLKEISRVFQRSFREVSRALKESSKGVQVRLKGISSSFKGV